MNANKFHVLDEVWMLVNKDDEVVYVVGSSAVDIWVRVEDEFRDTIGYSVAELRKKGFRAKKVKICI